MSADAEVPVRVEGDAQTATEDGEVYLESTDGDSEAPAHGSALVCDLCGQRYKATSGHCHGGRWGGCCISFASTGGFDAHRTRMRSTPDGNVKHRCLTQEQMLKKGWRQDADGFWHVPEVEGRRPSHWGKKPDPEGD